MRPSPAGSGHHADGSPVRRIESTATLGQLVGSPGGACHPAGRGMLGQRYGMPIAGIAPSISCIAGEPVGEITRAYMGPVHP